MAAEQMNAKKEPKLTTEATATFQPTDAHTFMEQTKSAISTGQLGAQGQVMFKILRCRLEVVLQAEMKGQKKPQSSVSFEGSIDITVQAHGRPGNTHLVCTCGLEAHEDNVYSSRSLNKEDECQVAKQYEPEDGVFQNLMEDLQEKYLNLCNQEVSRIEKEIRAEPGTSAAHDISTLVFVNGSLAMDNDIAQTVIEEAISFARHRKAVISDPR